MYICRSLRRSFSRLSVLFQLRHFLLRAPASLKSHAQFHPAPANHGGGGTAPSHQAALSVVRLAHACLGLTLLPPAPLRQGGRFVVTFLKKKKQLLRHFWRNEDNLAGQTVNESESGRKQRVALGKSPWKGNSISPSIFLASTGHKGGRCSGINKKGFLVEGSSLSKLDSKVGSDMAVYWSSCTRLSSRRGQTHNKCMPGANYFCTNRKAAKLQKSHGGRHVPSIMHSPFAKEKKRDCTSHKPHSVGGRGGIDKENHQMKKCNATSHYHKCPKPPREKNPLNLHRRSTMLRGLAYCVETVQVAGS